MMDKETKQVFWVWADMIGRCSNSNHKAFHNYGGRGITVCEEWASFAGFKRDMWPRPDGGMIDRMDNNAGYSKDNCKWSNRKEQNSNRRNCIYVVVEGAEVTLKEACRILGMRYRPVHKRLSRGWDIASALYTPIGIGNSHG